jgi:hypothetical protein
VPAEKRRPQRAALLQREYWKTSEYEYEDDDEDE